MVTTTDTPIIGLIEPPSMVADMRETASDLVRRFAHADTLVAIVTDAGRPMGLIRRGVAESEAGEGKLVGQLTVEPLTAFARDTATVGEIIAMHAPADLDRLPIIDADGMLVGELPRTHLSAVGGMEDYRAEIVAAKLGEEMPITVQVGQKVVGRDLHEIGTVKDVVMEAASGRVGQIVVEEGLLFKTTRRVPIDLIDPTPQDGRVHLKVDKEDIDRLGTLDDERA